METEYPQNLPENKIQIVMIQKMAKKMGLDVEQVAKHWVELFSPTFRELWESGVRDMETIESRLYTRETLGSNYADMVAAILISTPDPRLSE